MIKKNVLAAAITMTIAGSSMAMEVPSIKFQMRGDLVTSDTKGADDNATQQRLPYMRLDIKGKVKDDLSYRVKFRLNKELDKTSDGSGKGVDYAYITHKMENGLSIKLGKQYINIGGYESMFSSRDTYSQSSLVFNKASFYRTAVGAFYKVGGHSFNIQIANNDEEDTSKDMMYGAQAILSFADGMVKPLLSYHLDTTHTDINAGLQLNVADLTLELDHQIRENDKVANVEVDDDVSSSVFVKYKAGKWVPQIRYTQAEDATYKSFDSYHVAVEYFPYDDSTLRYHLAYVKTDNEVVTGGDATKNNDNSSVTAGFALSF
jgi:hypothetical protein